MKNVKRGTILADVESVVHLIDLTNQTINNIITHNREQMATMMKTTMP